MRSRMTFMTKSRTFTNAVAKMALALDAAAARILHRMAGEGGGLSDERHNFRRLNIHV